MKLTFTTHGGELMTLDLADDMELENVKALCEMDLRVPTTNMILSANGQRLTDNKKTLQDSGLKDGDVVLVETSVPNPGPPRLQSGPTPSKIPKIDFSSISVPGPGTSSSGSRSQPIRPNAGGNSSGVSPAELMRAKAIAENIRESIKQHPATTDSIRERFPQVLEAALKDDFATIAQLTRKEEEEAARRTRLLFTNPDSHEAQQMIQDQIRRQIIEDNFEYAVEHAPESLASVHMLYVNCSVNGIKMKAFVDSGAQVSIISREFAVACNIAHLVDERFQGVAVGVGSQRFVGKVHACQMEIGGAFLTTAFNVLDDSHMQILLGLDMLKRHQMVIDLKRNVLVIGTTGAETGFLHENEIPKNDGGEGRLFIPNETDILALIGMGFSRELSREALIKHHGNKDAAAADLLNRQNTTEPI